jgi:hypothetical protein
VAPTPAADWFAFGVTVHLLCEGRLPFTPAEVVESVGRGELPVLRFERIRPNRPPATLVRSCLAFRPGDRPADLDAVRAQLFAPVRSAELRTRVRESMPREAIPAHAYTPGPRARQTYPGLDPPRPPRAARLFRLALVGVLGGLVLAALLLGLRGRTGAW